MTAGTVTIDGKDIEEESRLAKERIGYMPEAVPLYPEMRVGEYLAFRADLKGVSRSNRSKRVGIAMEKAKVGDREMTLIGNLSKGYRQRVGLADALVADPPLLILDEPTSGLDPNQIREVRDVIKGLGSDHTVLLSTHILSEVESSCDRVIVIARGKLVAEGTTDAIKNLQRSPGLEVRVRGSGKAAASAIEGILGVAKVETTTEGELAIVKLRWSKKATETDEASEQITAALVNAGLGVRSITPISSSLEEVFAQLTEPSHEDADG